jgi:ribosomal protein L22
MAASGMSMGMAARAAGTILDPPARAGRAGRGPVDRMARRLTTRAGAFSLLRKAEAPLPISFGKSKEEDVVSLIAGKKYARAIEVLKAQLQRKGANPSLRMQLADVLILADKKAEAVTLLLPLADQYARDGFAAKAVSVLKKIQKVDPGRRDVEERLARQIEERQRDAVVLPRSSFVGIEDRRAPAGPPEHDPSTEIGFSLAPVSAPVSAPAAPEEPIALPPPRAPLPPRAAPAPESPDATLPVDSPRASALLPTEAPAIPPAPAAPEEGIEDYDLLYAGDEEDEEEELEVPLEAIEEAPSPEPMSAGQFADELMGLVDSVFQEFPAAAPSAPPPPDASARGGGSQIVVSPLFRDFAVDEMVAVIQGLKLLTFDRGEAILREGQLGQSLYTLTSGRVRVFRRDTATGRQKPLGDLKEGAFFGEISILTGQPRMATIVALTRCELLELDRPTLDEITKAHPHVWDVLREFAGKRAAQSGS